MAEFKKISDVDVINTLTDNDNVVVIGSDGALKQTSSGNLGMDITKTEVVEAPAEEDNLVLVSNGTVKQVSAAAFAAASGGGNEPIYLIPTGGTPYSYNANNYVTADGSAVPENLYELWLAGTPVFITSADTNNIYHGVYNKVISASAEEDPYVFLFVDMIKGDICYFEQYFGSSEK